MRNLAVLAREGPMDETEEMLTCVTETVLGCSAFTYQGHVIRVERPWKRITLFEAIHQHAGIDLGSPRYRKGFHRSIPSL